MANKFEQLIEYIVNSEEQKAQELFHEIVVDKSREIYENIIDEETADLEESEEETVEEAVEEETVEEAVEEDSTDEEAVEENFDLEMNRDETDDLIADVVADEVSEEDDESEMDMEMPMDGEEEQEEEEEEEELEDRVEDLESALDLLKQEFDSLMDQEDEMEEGIVREYDEKAPAPEMSEKTDSKTSPVADKGAPETDKDPADMPAKGGEESGREAPSAENMKATTEPDMKEV